MTTDPTADLRQQLDNLRTRAANLPTAEDAIRWDEEDRALVPRVRAVMPGVPAHHVLAVLRALRAIGWFDSTPAPAAEPCATCPQRATAAELEARQRHTRSAAGRCPMCSQEDTNGRLCDDCTRTVRSLPPAERRPWDRFRQRSTGTPLQGHGYTPAGLLGIDTEPADRPADPGDDQSCPPGCGCLC